LLEKSLLVKFNPDCKRGNKKFSSIDLGKNGKVCEEGSIKDKKRVSVKKARKRLERIEKVRLAAEELLNS